MSDRLPKIPKPSLQARVRQLEMQNAEYHRELTRMYVRALRSDQKIMKLKGKLKKAKGED